MVKIEERKSGGKIVFYITEVVKGMICYREVMTEEGHLIL